MFVLKILLVYKYLKYLWRMGRVSELWKIYIEIWKCFLVLVKVYYTKKYQVFDLLMNIIELLKDLKFVIPFYKNKIDGQKFTSVHRYVHKFSRIFIKIFFKFMRFQLSQKFYIKIEKYSISEKIFNLLISIHE